MGTSLKQKIGLFGLTASGIGIILGAGIYAIIGEAARLAGPSVWLSFLLGAFISAFTGLSYAELSTSIPKAAAEYSYMQEATQNSLASFLVGWIIIITESVAAAAVAISFGGYLSGLFGTPKIVFALALLVGLSLLNYLGIELSNQINIVFTIIEVVGLLIIIALGIPLLGSMDYLSFPQGFNGILQGSALIFFAYIGFENIANLAEESKNPFKDMPRAIIVSIIFTSFIYVLVALSAVSLVDWRELSQSTSPLALAASKALGQSAFNLLSVIALFATANTVLILLIVCSRTIFGMAREGRLPKPLSNLSNKGSPTPAIALSLGLAVAFSLLENLSLVVEITNLGTFITFTSVNLSAIILRVREPDKQIPFKTPFQIGKIPIIPLIGLLSSGLLITQLSQLAIIIGGITILVGFSFYRFCKTPFAKRIQCEIID
ncbi:MAG: APC family permease [Candidatus Bathyarchaeota archaeon]|nr:APC family permease [Candidatus Bathyarchaeota archaeon]